MAPVLESHAEVAKHVEFLNLDDTNDIQSENRRHVLPEEIITTPLFSLPSRLVLAARYPGNGNEGNHIFPQYGLIGHRAQDSSNSISGNSLVYMNSAAPWSTFICGSQGSGKSHTLSCLLENYLFPSSPVGHLTAPLSGVIFHYDRFTGFSNTQICEAAYLCSSQIPVRVFVSPTNFLAMKKAYTNLPGLGDVSEKLTVEPMYLPVKGLNISMMKTLMGIESMAGQPLYVEMVMKILRDMAITNQGRDTFDYALFKCILEEEEFMKTQQTPLRMRLDGLESFFEPGSVPGAKKNMKASARAETQWTFAKGSLTIIDLSSPFIGPDDACALFNICISLFLGDQHQSGRILAFDEAHKFLTSTSSEALDLTETLLSIVRQQRHLGTRVVIATQEPTIAPSLLDLCNMTIIHRFTSPAWFQSIKAHLAGADADKSYTKDIVERDLFRRIVQLSTGEALLFCPTALLDVIRGNVELGMQSKLHGSNSMIDNEEITADSHRPIQLGTNYAHIRIRKRVTADGGRSLIAQ
ncbi:hypothetical protein N7462_010647 [Penicillium macrosclerotiorum]|uniref:uncharacterized protein n=1 Tax=Penicillium macrosclerotiorum TaxID=303699 RepID=UPI00254878D7|nr:uncharacterized protein N7462_010647 [Penicillium macrosclerotiorum]KAJ5669577.1 hypothetical protein N7462_010647 [Penicillium macrosclerotiorum]